MSATDTGANAEQRAAWDGNEGTHWAEHAERYEASSAGYRASLWASLETTPADRVLDVGCGTGALSREAAGRVPEGHVLGVDLSTAMLARARELAGEEGLTNVSFLQADAQTHAFADAGADVVVSGFAAMFFDDQRAAFANLGRALRPGGSLTLTAWQGLDANEWLRCIRGALSVGRDLPVPPPGQPGPFGLVDPRATRAVLEDSGFGDIEVTSVETPMCFGPDADRAHAFLKGQGVTAGMLSGLDEVTRTSALDALHAVLRDHETPAGVCFDSAAWLIRASR